MNLPFFQRKNKGSTLSTPTEGGLPVALPAIPQMTGAPVIQTAVPAVSLQAPTVPAVATPTVTATPAVATPTVPAFSTEQLAHLQTMLNVSPVGQPTPTAPVAELAVPTIPAPIVPAPVIPEPVVGMTAAELTQFSASCIEFGATDIFKTATEANMTYLEASKLFNAGITASVAEMNQTQVDMKTDFTAHNPTQQSRGTGSEEVFTGYKDMMEAIPDLVQKRGLSKEDAMAWVTKNQPSLLEFNLTNN